MYSNCEKSSMTAKRKRLLCLCSYGCRLVRSELPLERTQRRSLLRLLVDRGIVLSLNHGNGYGTDVCAGHQVLRSSFGLHRRSIVFRLEKLLRVQQRTPQRRIVARPCGLEFAFAFKLRTHALHLRIEVIEIMQHKRLREHGQLGRAKLVLPVMADDKVLDQDL